MWKTNCGISLSQQEGWSLRSAPRKSSSTYLGTWHQGWDNSSSGIWIPSSSPALGSYMAQINPRWRWGWDGCETRPAEPSKRSKRGTRGLHQLQVSRERRCCWYLTLLTCSQNLSCARRHRIYSVLVFSFLLKLTRNPPMSSARVNKLNKLTILFTFSETGSFCSYFNLFYYTKQAECSVMGDGH